MAKKKMTLEEKLEEAIVKDIPYKIPDNWYWVKLGSLFDICSSKRIVKEQWRENGIPFYRTREIVAINKYGFVNNDLFIDEYLYEEIKEKYGVPNKNDIMVTAVGTLGKTYIVKDNKFYFKDANVLWFKNINNLNVKYIHYLYQSLFMNDQIYGLSSGSTVETYTIINAKKTMIPLPPLREQQRIVDKIENLFRKLDKAKELIEEAREDFEKRKSAILEKAFRGDLTKEWGNNKGITKAYKEYTLKDLLKPMTNKKPDISKEYFRYIDIDSINNKKQVVGIPKVIETSKAPSRASREVRNGDVLFSIVRPYLKNIAYITEDLEDCIASTGFYICRCKELLEPKFLYRLLCSDKTLNYYTSLMKGDNSPSIRKGEFEGLIIDLPSLDEQKEIVRILDEILEEESKIEELTKLENQIELIKKSILAKAFRGQLGTNCEDDQSALELLKEILKDK